jgi:hypothetical protein
MSGYGRHFRSMYTGSMVGMGTDVFAVWGYVIAHVRDGVVELNPRLLAGIFGSTREAMVKALSDLCAPDPESRNPDQEGRRLIHEQAYMYRVVSAEKYLELMRSMNAKDSNAERQAKYRANHPVTPSNGPVTPRNAPSREVTQSESESESESEGDGDREPRRRGRAKPRSPELPLPDGFCLTAQMGAYAKSKGWLPEKIIHEFERFINHAVEKDRRSRNWVRAWQGWVLKDADFVPAQSGTHRVVPQDRGSQSSIAFQRQLERIAQLEAEEKAS